VVFTLIKDGDHRLSRPQDIERLLAGGRVLMSGDSLKLVRTENANQPSG
jgi:hypothetical protein